MRAREWLGVAGVLAFLVGLDAVAPRILNPYYVTILSRIGIAVIAAVLGGIGSVPGAMVGGLLLGVIETFVTAYLSSTYRDAIAFVILVLILLYRPTGLFGAPQTEKV